MKALFILILSTVLFVGCGKMKTNNETSGNVLSSLNSSGLIGEEEKEELEGIDPSLLEEQLSLIETDKAESIIMKLGDAELLIDFVKNLTGKSNEIAMIINGIKVTSQVAANPKSFQALIASIVEGQLKGKELAGVPLKDLIKHGLKLVNGDIGKHDFSKLFGVLVKGAFKLFLSGTPYGVIFQAILDPVLDGVLGNSNQNANTNNPSKDVVDSIVDSVGGALTGSDPKLGGLLSLIMTLFK